VKLRAAPQQGELPGRPRQAFAAVVAPPPVAGGMHFRSEYLAAVTLPTPALTGSTTERKVFAGESARLMFAQTCIVGVIFIALAYRLFEPGWTGTFQEMLGVFAWGFFIDLSADGVLPLLRKMIPAAATA
jgi:hypothetical protein